MDMSKRAAVALTGLLLSGAAALTMGAATPANATMTATAPFSDDYFNGGGGGGGGGTYNPYQIFAPVILIGKF